jgi:hypothetical protein
MRDVRLKITSNIRRKSKVGKEARLVCTCFGTINLFGFHITMRIAVEVLSFHEFIHSYLETRMVVTLGSLHSTRKAFFA